MCTVKQEADVAGSRNPSITGPQLKGRLANLRTLEKSLEENKDREENCNTDADKWAMGGGGGGRRGCGTIATTSNMQQATSNYKKQVAKFKFALPLHEGKQTST